MFKARMCNFYISLVILLTFFEFSFCQNVPFVSCSNIFEYNFDGSDWFGVVNLKDIVAPGLAFKLTVDMTLSENMPQNYLGSLDLKINRKEPAEYKIKFPLPAVLPKLAEIRFNENIICSSTSEGGVPTTTVLVLEQTASGRISFDVDIQGVKIQITRNVNDKSGTARIKNEENRFAHAKKNSPNCGQLADKFKHYPVDYSVGEFERGTWPWLVAIYHQRTWGEEYECVGSLITNNAVLTATHCVNPHKPDKMIVYVGVHDRLELRENGGIRSTVSEIYSHDVNRPSYDGEISILQLYERIKFSAYIQPACLWAGPTDLEDVVGENGYYAGWGQGGGLELSNKPLKADGNIVSQEDCLRSNSQFRYLTSDRTFCVESRNGAGPCVGDYGTGFFIKKGAQWVLRGILAGSLSMNGTCDLNNYAVYTDVAQFIDWVMPILTNITDASQDTRPSQGGLNYDYDYDDRWRG